MCVHSLTSVPHVACSLCASYASINGVPSCGNSFLTTMVREVWGRPDVVQVCVWVHLGLGAQRGVGEGGILERGSGHARVCDYDCRVTADH